VIKYGSFTAISQAVGDSDPNLTQKTAYKEIRANTYMIKYDSFVAISQAVGDSDPKLTQKAAYQEIRAKS
jgi:hypothetical protein